MAFYELKKSEPASIADYRDIVSKAKIDFAVSEAAKRLAVVGDSRMDVPFVIDALDRARARSRSDTARYVASDIERILVGMTGLSLPENTPTDQWRKAWSERQAAAGAKITSP